MTLTIDQARDAVYGIVDAAWKAGGAPTELVPMLYDDVRGDPPETETVPGQRDPFARTSVRILSSPQETLSASPRYQTTGTVAVQIFTPFGDGHTLGDAFAKVVLAALRGHVGSVDGVWFFDAVSIEVGQSGPWFQRNVTASFRFQEVA